MYPREAKYGPSSRLALFRAYKGMVLSYTNAVRIPVNSGGSQQKDEHLLVRRAHQNLHRKANNSATIYKDQPCSRKHMAFHMKVFKKFFSPFRSTKINQRRNQDFFAFQSLPNEMKQRVVAFLSVSDTVLFVLTCKTMVDDLDLAADSSPLTDRASQNKAVRSSTAQCFAVVVPNDIDRLHSMTFQCIQHHDSRWSDENKIWIVEQDKPVVVNNGGLSTMTEIPFLRGQIVARWSQPQRDEYITLSFYPKANKVYQLFCRTESSARAWRLKNMKLHRFGFGDNSIDYAAFQVDVMEDRRILRSLVR